MGFTLPGIIDDPGSFAGRINSPKPHHGPEAISLISLTILWMELAKLDKIEWNCVKESFVYKAWNLFYAGQKPIANSLPSSSQKI